MRSIKLGNLTVFITNDVLQILDSYKQKGRHDLEAGGVLLGQVVRDNVYIMRATVPNSFDKSTRVSFERNKEIAQILVDFEFINSQRKTIYLGEWHTHPENYPTPSGTDRSMIIDQFRKNKLNEPFILTLIYGTNGFYIGKYDGTKLEEASSYE